MNLASNQIPSSINTVEKMVAWAGLLLHRGNPTLKVNESLNYSDFAAQASLFTAQDGTTRLVIRCCIEVDPAFAEANAKLWTQVKSMSEQAIPAAYTS
jgi:hypothetical protein